jgi:hypothetical protein
MTYKASDLYNDIKGGTQRANAWAGFLQEEIEEDRKINLPIERAYDVTDATQLTASKYEMYPIPDKSLL